MACFIALLELPLRDSILPGDNISHLYNVSTHSENCSNTFIAVRNCVDSLRDVLPVSCLLYRDASNSTSIIDILFTDAGRIIEHPIVDFASLTFNCRVVECGGCILHWSCVIRETLCLPTKAIFQRLTNDDGEKIVCVGLSLTED